MKCAYCDLELKECDLIDGYVTVYRCFNCGEYDTII